MKEEPIIEVGIMKRKSLRIVLDAEYSSGDRILEEGLYEATITDQTISLKNNSDEIITQSTFELIPMRKDSTFELNDVTIGIGFHWEQFENQRFRGSLKLIPEDNAIRAINRIEMEEYLRSVISSEMSATNSLELLKAHAVISRSWLLAQIHNKKGNVVKDDHQKAVSEDEIIRWYDREDHLNFDVCADDHCQRYQGTTRIISGKAAKAVEETRGEVLWSEDRICDARFSKCCGGVSENFENVWEPVRHRYLTKVVDSAHGDTTCVDLRQEDEAQLWIRNHPDAFCNTSDEKVLRQILPDFDLITNDFYRWKVTFSQKELAALLKEKSGIDFGEIIELQPLKRGHSSRIITLRIHGTKKTVTVGKELEIRKWLSKTHLYSSAFVVDHLNQTGGIPQKIVLTGAGWGHGVGMCQIGAAVMGEKGYSYREILSHYFKGAGLNTLY